jgi:hypothetical protein
VGAGGDSGGSDSGVPEAGKTDGSLFDAPSKDATDGGDGSKPTGFYISSQLSLDKTTVNVGETLNGTVTYTNNSAIAISVTQIVIAARRPGATHAGGPYDDLQPEVGASTLQPAASVTLSASRAFTSADALGQWESYPTYGDATGSHDGPSIFFNVVDAQCTAESDSAFCQRLAKNCGSVTAADNCGANRTVGDCGVCSVQGQTCGGGGTANRCGSPASTTGNPLLGINTQWANSWFPLVPYANVFLTGRKPCAVNSWNTSIPLDADGNATTDFSIMMYEGAMSPFSGKHRLRFRGQADLQGMGVTISNKSYDALTNITTADADIDATQNDAIHFTTTRRVPGDSGSTGLTELSLAYPGTDPDVEVVTPHFRAAVAPFGILRPMQAMIPSNPTATWSERNRPRGPGSGDDKYGIPFERVVLMGNALDKDIWINVPYFLDADGQTKLAQLVEFGSDGDLPYTGPYGSSPSAANPRPAQYDPSTWTPSTITWYPPLKAGLHAYVELSNELWNFGAAYLGNQLQDDAVAEYGAGDPYHYGILSGSNPGYLRMGRQGRLHKELADRFLAVVGDGAWGSRYRMVLSTQISWHDMIRSPMTYIATVYGGHTNTGTVLGPIETQENGSPNAWGNPAWPVSRFVHYLSGAPYVQGETAAAQVAEIQATTKGDIAALKQFCDQYSVKMIAYEGGPERNPGYSDPQLKQVVVDLLHAWFAADSSAPFVYYGIADNDGYGLSPTIFDTDGSLWPKWGGIYQIASELPAP